jgi:micrococcal nuclease
MFDYNAKILRIVDGDTIEVEIDLGFYMKYKNTVRLSRINAEELRDKDVDKKEMANKAKDFLKTLLPVNTEVVVISKSLDKYGRILGEVIIKDKNVSDLLLENKLVNLY